MEQVGDIKLYSFEEVKDELIGKTGTPEREEHERKVAEAIRESRIGQNLTRQPSSPAGGCCVGTYDSCVRSPATNRPTAQLTIDSRPGFCPGGM